MYLVKTPGFIQNIFKDVIWNVPNESNEVYLTFDDGPVPGITDKVIKVLNQYQAKATFFVLGKNVEEHPDLYRMLLNAGHQIGNHSYSHLKGWTTSNDVYLEDVSRASSKIDSHLFRPPYGKIKRQQLKKLPGNFKVIMWDVLPGDFSPRVNVDDLVKNTLENVESGSIIVLHDNAKCGEKMLEALPVIIQGIQEKGFTFSVLS